MIFSRVKILRAYHLYGKSGNSEENSNGTVIPVEIFRKKVMPFEVIPFPVFTETTEIFCTICLDYQCQAPSQEKSKNPVPGSRCQKNTRII